MRFKKKQGGGGLGRQKIRGGYVIEKRGGLEMKKTKELMHCHCGTNNRAPRRTFTDPCKPEVRPGAREESASPAWLAAPAMNARDTMKVYIWRLDTGCGPTLYRKCHSHNTSGKRHNNT